MICCPHTSLSRSSLSRASPRVGMGWTCPPHFCPRLFLRLMQIWCEFLGGSGHVSLTLSLFWPSCSSKRSSIRLMRLGSVVQWGFAVNVWATICADLLCSATSHITKSTISNCFSVDTQYCPCRRGRYLHFVEICITNRPTWGLGSLQNSRMRQICCFRWASKIWKVFSFRGLRPRNPLTRGSVPGSRWAGGLALAMCVNPTFLTWQRP